jgi:hypothetical protein
VDELQQLCNDLLGNTNALLVLIMDANWRELAHAGPTTLLDANALSLLRANASGLPIEREVAGHLDNPANHHFHLSLIVDRTIVVVFDERTSLGLVRLRAKKATEDLSRLSIH